MTLVQFYKDKRQLELFSSEPFLPKKCCVWTIENLEKYKVCMSAYILGWFTIQRILLRIYTYNVGCEHLKTYIEDLFNSLRISCTSLIVLLASHISVHSSKVWKIKRMKKTQTFHFEGSNNFWAGVHLEVRQSSWLLHFLFLFLIVKTKSQQQQQPKS